MFPIEPIKYDCRHYTGYKPCHRHDTCLLCPAYAPQGRRALLIATTEKAEAVGRIAAELRRDEACFVVCVVAADQLEDASQLEQIDRVLPWTAETRAIIAAEYFDEVIDEQGLLAREQEAWATAPTARPPGMGTHILIVKLAAMGDVLRTLSVLPGLARALPGARVTWVTSKAAFGLLRGHPLIDRLLPFGDEALELAQRESFELALNFEKDAVACALASLAHAERKKGFSLSLFGTPAAFDGDSHYALQLGLDDELKFNLNEKTYPEIIYEMAGLEYAGESYEIPLTPERAEARERFLAEHDKDDATRWIGLHTGCGPVFATKQWTLDGFGELIERLDERGDARGVLFGGPAEAEFNGELLRRCGDKIIDAGCHNTLDEFIGLLDACEVIVCADTLAMHLAVARGKRVVALLGPTSRSEIDLFGRGVKVSADFDCAPCYRQTCDKTPTCMAALGAQTVLEAIERQLEASNDEGAGSRGDVTAGGEDPSVGSTSGPPGRTLVALGERDVQQRQQAAATLNNYSGFGPLLVLALALVLGALLAPTAARIINYGGHCIAYPYQLDPEEGILLFQALELRAGRNFYRPLTDYPFVAGTYAPVYQTVNAFLLLFSSPSLAPGRILSLVCVLALTALLGWIIFSQTRNCPAALSAPLLFLVTYEVTNWIGFYRVDLLAILFGVAGLALLLEREQTNRRAYLAGLLFLLAGYTKQIQLVAPLAATAYFLFTDRRVAKRLAAVWLGGGLALFLLANLLTRGQFYIHTVVYNANEFDWLGFRGWLGHIDRFYRFELLAVLVALASLVAVIVHARRAKASRPEPRGRLGLIVLYALLNLLYVVGIAKKGTTVNYLLEPLFACALLIGVALGTLAARRSATPGAALARYAALVMIALLLVVHAYQITAREPNSDINPALYWNLRAPAQSPRIAYDRGLAADTVEFIRQADQKGEEVYCELPLLNTLAGRPVLYQPFIMTRLAREGKWDQRPFVADLERQRFDFLILTVNVEALDPSQEDSLYTREMIQAIRRGYRLTRRFENTSLFKYYYYRRVKERGGALAQSLGLGQADEHGQNGRTRTDTIPLVESSARCGCAEFAAAVVGARPRSSVLVRVSPFRPSRPSRARS
ncbi:glycosyltransferase family 9 protein [Candidatus Sumerlaeota bacterium]